MSEVLDSLRIEFFLDSIPKHLQKYRYAKEVDGAWGELHPFPQLSTYLENWRYISAMHSLNLAMP